MMRLFSSTAYGSTSSEIGIRSGLCVTANGAVVAIAAVFLNSYLGRVARMPAYWLPTAGLAGIVALYFVRTRRAALRLNGNAGADPSG